MRLLLIVGFLVMISCKKKEDSCDVCLPGTYSNVSMKVVNTFPVNGVGCGWCLRDMATNELYSPDVFGNSFQISDITVTVTYQKTSNKLVCPNAPVGGMTVIHVVSIRR